MINNTRYRFSPDKAPLHTGALLRLLLLPCKGDLRPGDVCLINNQLSRNEMRMKATRATSCVR